MPASGHIVFNQMSEIFFGKPAAESVAAAASSMGAENVFVVASATLNSTTDEVTKIASALGDRHAGTCDSIPAHTPREAVVDAAAQASAADADLIVSIGGGSVTDGGKAMQLCIANNVETADAMNNFQPVPGPDGTPTPPQLVAPAVRQLAIPTTLSAAEFTPISGVTNTAEKSKELFRHPLIIPEVVVLDPAITVHTPEWLWMSTGIRAIDHCVEGVCSNLANPYGDAQALEGIRLLSSGLRRVKADASDIEARADCQMGTWLATGPFSSGVPMGASHGVGYILGALHDVPHGHTSCVMLPSVMRWNKSVNSDRQDLVSNALGRPGQDAGDALDELITDLGMPNTLSAVGVMEESFDKVAELSMNTPWVPHNPRPIPGPAQVREILDLAR